MLSRWYDPILILGAERTLPSKIASLLGLLGVDIRPVPLHIDATAARWEDHELRHCQMDLLSEKISLRAFNLRVAILSEQRRRTRAPWGMASSYSADVLVPMLSHYLSPLVLWCQCEPSLAAALLLNVQPATSGWDATDAMALCTRRHEALDHWLKDYQVLPINGHAILDREPGLIDQLIDFCGLHPTAGQLYQAMQYRPSHQQGAHDEEKENDRRNGQAVRHNGSDVPRQQVSS